MAIQAKDVDSTTTIAATGSAGKTLFYVTAGGVDTIIGGAENDIIFAGNGLGTYTTGMGTDTIKFLAASNSAGRSLPANYNAAGDDLVNGFAVGADKIDLIAIALTQKSHIDKGVVVRAIDIDTAGYFGARRRCGVWRQQHRLSVY
ncbi:MAG: hypothetical protein U1E70_22650 [Acetobacteraceae bacterium]